MRARILRLLLVGALTAAAPRTVAAQIYLVDEEGASLAFGGYVRSLTGFSDLRYELPGVEPRSGFNAEVGRLEWDGRIGEVIAVELQQRVQLQITSASGGGSFAGFGVSAVPGRTVDLAATVAESEHLLLRHDVDRLAVRLYTDAVDLTLGRQAITWGLATLFPIADLWAQFSPFELDTEEKPGIDALRALLYPAPGLELDLVVADRGSLADLSGGARATLSLASADVYVAGGKLWNEVMVWGGVALLLEQVKLRGEAALPWNLDEDAMTDARVTVGADWVTGRLQLTGEYHFNGLGARHAAGYLERLRSPEFARGESYYLGRHYAGGLVAYTPNERLTLATSALVNLRDPSASLSPVLAYDVGRSSSLSLGLIRSLGATPPDRLPPAPDSEFGLYGDIWFTRMSLYF